MKRKHALDILRIIATILIVFHHYQQVIGDFSDGSFSFYSGGFYFGYMVEFFFVLSGFLMYRYVGKINDGLNFGVFIGKRALRLLPSVFLSSLAFYLLHIIYVTINNDSWLGGYPHWWEIIINGLGLQAGWFFSSNRLNFPLWYVSVLFLCYFWFYFLTRISKKTKIPKELFYFTMIVIGLGIRICLARGILVHIPVFNGFASRGYIAFYFGLLAACYLRKWKRLDLYLVPGISLVIFLALFYVNIGVMEYSMMIYAFGIIVALFSCNWINKHLDIPALEIIGNSTLYVYMWHMPCMLLIVIIRDGLLHNMNLESWLSMIMFTFLLFTGSVGIEMLVGYVKKKKKKV